MNVALVVCAAPQADADVFYRQLITAHRGLVIAADAGGGVCLSHGRVPDLLVGDFDSIGSDVLEQVKASGAQLRRSPAEKDVTDLDLALEAVRDLDVGHATVTAAWSARLDHTLSAIGSVFRHTELTIDLVDPDMAGWILDAEGRCSMTLSGPGAIFSLLALDDKALVSCSGARYPLESATLGALASRGLSNVVLETPAIVRVDRGRLLVLSHSVSGTDHARFSTGSG
ncbi:MAG: thiamine diphosphokinase [Coriobacteriia bacterium]|nr:thiamine diphosphokinase [Coriobacteriia bacterium]